MNTPLVPSLASAQLPNALKKKRVLLVDTSAHKRDLRADVMRKLGMDVDCAADITEANSWWKADLYDLVLVNMEKGPGQRDNFCEDVRRATPAQRLAFLVGKPVYIADSPNIEEDLRIDDARDHTVAGDIKAALTVDVGTLTQRWGILEASRRISAVRTACNARTQALQNRPAPPRDFEGRPSKRNPASALDNLLKEEMQ